MATECEESLASSKKPSTREEVHAWRGTALDQYIHLEKQSAAAFEFAVGARDITSSHHKKTQIAQEVFSQVIKDSNNHRKLLRKIADVYLPEEYSDFVRSLLKAFQKASETRNLIAHNETGVVECNDGQQRHFICSKNGGLDDTSLFVEDLVCYIRELKYLFHAVCVYRSAVLGTPPEWVEARLYEATLRSALNVPPNTSDPLVEAGFW